MTTSPTQLKFAALALLAAGAALVVAVSLHPEGLNAPTWVAHLAALVLVLAGALSLARGYRRERLAGSLYCLVLGAFAALGAWIAFGPGERQCVASIPGLTAVSPEGVCRWVFGLGAAVVVAMLAVAIGTRLKRRSRPA